LISSIAALLSEWILALTAVGVDPNHVAEIIQATESHGNKRRSVGRPKDRRATRLTIPIAENRINYIFLVVPLGSLAIGPVDKLRAMSLVGDV